MSDNHDLGKLVACARRQDAIVMMYVHKLFASLFGRRCTAHYDVMRVLCALGSQIHGYFYLFPFTMHEALPLGH